MAAVHLEGTSDKNQDKMKTKQFTKWKIHANKLHTMLGHTGEDRTRATANHLCYIVKGVIEVCEDYDTAKKIINIYKKWPSINTSCRDK